MQVTSGENILRGGIASSLRSIYVNEVCSFLSTNFDSNSVVEHIMLHRVFEVVIVDFLWPYVPLLYIGEPTGLCTILSSGIYHLL